MRTAGVGQAHELGGFVEAFTCGIIECGAPAFVYADIFADQNLCVAAGNEEQEVGELYVISQARGEGVAF